MFIEKYDGIYYLGSDNLEYELLEGKSSNDYTSDIIFILDRNKGREPQVIDFVYGGFKNLQKDFIQATIENYIEKNKGVK